MRNTKITVYRLILQYDVFFSFIFTRSPLFFLYREFRFTMYVARLIS